MSALRIGQTAWLLLALLQVLWHGVLRAPPAVLVLPALLLALLPLLLPLLARAAPRRLWWAAVAALLYFCHGVMEAWSAPAERGLALVEIALSILLIGALGADARRSHRRTDV